MIDRLDQIFVLLKHWLIGFLPSEMAAAAGVVLCVVVIIVLFPALFALTTILERKGLGRIQNRLVRIASGRSVSCNPSPTA